MTGDAVTWTHPDVSITELAASISVDFDRHEALLVFGVVNVQFRSVMACVVTR
jgi:hypothetical protein